MARSRKESQPSRAGADPHATREAERYERPIPSREFILALLERAGQPLAVADLRSKLKLDDPADLEALRRRLRAMCRDGQLLLNRLGNYALVDKLDLRAAHVSMRRDGSGMLRFDDRGADVPLPAEELRGLIDGDHVLARVEQDGDRPASAVIVELVERVAAPVVGVLWESGGALFVRPERGLLNEEILIPAAAAGSARPGDYVLVRLTHAEALKQRPIGEVVQVLGPPQEAGVEREVILHAHRIPREFSPEALADAARLPRQPTGTDVAHRIDLRDVPLITIDGEDARDFDDAVYAEPRVNGGHRLIVAIADVGHYVMPGSPLDVDAVERGNSVYFPDMVIPMLPEALSNGLCSLKPNEERLCLVCDMTVSRAGRVTGYRFYEGVMRSAARLTYNQVADALGLGAGPAASLAQIDASLGSGMHARLQNLLGVYEALRRQRETRGALDFQPKETRIVFDTRGRIERIELRVRNEAHQLIEECMVAANVCAAKLLGSAAPLVGVYRVHEPPAPDRWADLRTFLVAMGIKLQWRENALPTPGDLQQVLQETANRPHGHVVEMVILRSLMQAHYAGVNVGHFGLGLPTYTHFTSPIRRYADLLVHRAIRYLIRKGAGDQVERVKGAPRIAQELIYPYDAERVERITADISFTERRADTAVRDLEDWLKCDYMSEHLGEEFAATVATVQPFGVFVEVDDLFIQGLVHVSALGLDYFRYDHARMELRGERSGQSFRIGTPLRVKLTRVDLQLRRIDFVPADIEQRGADATPRKSKGPARKKRSR